MEPSRPHPKGRRDGRLTAVTFSRNEAYLLPACLSRLTEFDELLVCDMQSTDDTVVVATSHGASVVNVPFAPICEMVRQLAIDAVDTEWVLFVDADEHVPPGWRASLVLADIPSEIAGVRLRYDNVAFAVQLTHTLRGSAKYALLRSDLGHYETHYEDGRAHIPPIFDGPVIDAPLSVPPILHLNFRDVRQSLEKTLRYAESNPRGADAFANPFQLPREVVRDVVAGGAWRDGRAGIVLVTINAIGRFYAAALEWEQRGYHDPGWRPATRWEFALGGVLHRLLTWLRRRLGFVRRRSRQGPCSPS